MPTQVTESKFVHLAPTDDAENAEVYFNAFDYAIRRNEVLNIALTGPYGSGKSSVIKTYLKRYKGKALQLSLGSFLPDGDGQGNVTKQEIERSILQQILYGVDADKLPFSRFKRIRVPKRFSVGTSLLITIGLVCAWYLFSKQSEVLSGKFFDPFNWINYVSVVAVVILAWKLTYSAYTNSLGLSLKSISLKDVQIAPAATDQESILNRHLDEILYFFQSTDYDLVVIEDLDRFETPEIFVTLREINGLINANEGIKRRVRFLYALRDDIFANTDRTKFFEFIVPIVPVINHSNSIDKVLENSQRIDLDARLNKQFIREVSRYLSDLRLIQNIFNEYVVYSTNLDVHGEALLDANKLLAILIYKNVIPNDFAALHRQEGVLSDVLGRYDQYVAKIEADIRSQIAAIDESIQTGEEQALRDEAELRKVYAMAVVQVMPAGHHSILMQDGRFAFGQLVDGDLLEKVLASKSVVALSSQTRTSVDIQGVQRSVDPTRTFEQRKADISGKSPRFRKEADKRRRELEAKLSSLRTQRFNEVVRENTNLIEKAFAEVGENRDLLRYLILEGFLDDTYYQYISLFHSGRLSPKDNSFLIKIRAYNTPAPDFQLDNVAEVIDSMRPDDFGQSYVLNRFIVDHLFEHAVANASRIAAAIQFIAANFDECGEFFRSYYASGNHVDKLVASLAAKWPGFAEASAEETEGASHIARILAYASDRALQAPESKAALQSFLSENADRALAEGIAFRPDRFRSLAVEIAEVEKLAEYPETLSFVAQEGLYSISIDNIRSVFTHVVAGGDVESLERRHLSTLNAANDAALLRRIDIDFPEYVGEVLLKLPTNTEEDVSAILQVLARDDIEHDLRSEFLSGQTTLLPQLGDIPTEFQQIALEGHHVVPTWENCLQFRNSESFHTDVLTQYVMSDKAKAALTQQRVPSGEHALPLLQFLVGNDALDLGTYRAYVRLLPTFSGFPSVDAGKTKVLIEDRKVTFSSSNFQQLEDLDLKVLFVATNFDAYRAAKSEYPVDNDFRTRLLRTAITDVQKLDVLADIDEAFVAGTAAVAAVVGPLLDRSPTARLDYGVDFIKAIILHTRDLKVRISLLNKMHRAFSVQGVREVLRDFPSPFQDIATFGKSPKLDNNDANRQLVQWLKDRAVISSFSETLLGGEFRVNTFRKEVG